MSQPARAALFLAVTALLWSTGGLAIKLVPASPWPSRAGAVPWPPWSWWRFSGEARFPADPGLCLRRLQLCRPAGDQRGRHETHHGGQRHPAGLYRAGLRGPARALVLGERTRPADWAFVAACVGGMALFFLDRLSAQGLWGNLVACGTGFCYAVFTLAMRAGRGGSPVSAVIAGHGLAAALGLPFLLAEPPLSARPGSGSATWASCSRGCPWPCTSGASSGCGRCRPSAS